MNLIKTFLNTIILMFLSLIWACSNNMDQLYIVSVSHSAFPTGVPIDSDADGQVDGLDVNADGIMDMIFVDPVGIPSTGIDINNDGGADFYLYTTADGSTFNTKVDGSGETVTAIISGGNLIGYDMDGNGNADIYVSVGSAVNFVVGGTATGVTSPMILSLTINNSSFESITISSDGAFSFASKLNEGYYYQVAIASTSQQCSIENTSGVISASDITNIAITCGTLTVGGTINGPATIGTTMLSLTIDNSSTEFLTVSGASPLAFTFTSRLNTGSVYKVAIVSSSDTCKIASFSGTMAAANVSNVSVTCASYTVSGTIAPLLGASESATMTLNVNGAAAETKTFSNTGTISFNAKLFDGDVYYVQLDSVTRNPTRTCMLAGNIGTISTASYNGVQLNCGTYLAGVSVSSPTTAPSLTLSLSVNGVFKENITVSTTGISNFTHYLYNNDSYNIQIVSSSLRCTISGNIGTVTGAITPATVTCAQYTVGGAPGGGGGISPALTSGESVTLSLAVNGVVVRTQTFSFAGGTTDTFSFASDNLLPGDSYNVQLVSSTPSCTISNNVGSISTSAPVPVTNVALSCASYTVGNNGVSTFATGFNIPDGVTTDGANVFVVNKGTNDIQKIVISSGTVTTLASGFNMPEGITNDGINLYFSDSGNNRIKQIVISTGAVTTLSSAASINGPDGITTDGINVYVANTLGNNIIQVVIGTGATSILATGFNAPQGIATDGTNIYVADTGNHVIKQFLISTPGTVNTIAGLSGTSGSLDDPSGVNARFNAPAGISTDGANVYVTDTSNNKVRKIVLSGTYAVTTLAGSGAAANTDETGIAAGFNAPNGIVVRGSNLYIADTTNNAIRLLDTTAGLSGSNSATVALYVNGTYKETKTLSVGTETILFTATKLFTGDTYNVQLLSSTQLCKIFNNTGVVSGSKVNNVGLSCATDQVKLILSSLASALSGNMMLSLDVNGVFVENLTVPSGSVNGAEKVFATKIQAGDVYNVQILSMNDNCKIDNNVGSAMGYGGVGLTIACGAWSNSIVLNDVGACGGTLSVTMTIQLLNSSLNPTVQTFNTWGGLGVAFNSPYFKANDVYELNIGSSTFSGVCTRCSFNNGTTTLLVKNGTFSTASIVDNVYCW